MGVRIREIRTGRKFSVPKKLGELLVQQGKHEYHTTHMVAEDPSKPATAGAPAVSSDDDQKAPADFVGPPAPTEPVTPVDRDQAASAGTGQPPAISEPVATPDDDKKEPPVTGKKKRTYRRRASKSED